MTKLSDEIWLWIKDFIEVGVTLAVILAILRVTLGAHMLVPLVVVTSGSMTHYPGDESWRIWLADHNISEEIIGNLPLSGGFNQGDMIVTISPDAVLGDVIIYERDLLYGKVRGLEPIIHRVVGVVYVKDWEVDYVSGTLDCFKPEDFNTFIKYVKDCQAGGYCVYPMHPQSGSFRFYITKGDNNQGSDQCSQTYKIAIPVNDAQVTARGWIRIPYLGYLKIVLNAIIDVLFFWAK